MIEFLTSDKYALYVTAAYGATFAIIGWLILTTVRESARARREMIEAEERRRR